MLKAAEIAELEQPRPAELNLSCTVRAHCLRDLIKLNYPYYLSYILIPPDLASTLMLALMPKDLSLPPIIIPSPLLCDLTFSISSLIHSLLIASLSMLPARMQDPQGQKSYPVLFSNQACLAHGIELKMLTIKNSCKKMFIINWAGRTTLIQIYFFCDCFLGSNSHSTSLFTVLNRFASNLYGTQETTSLLH